MRIERWMDRWIDGFVHVRVRYIHWWISFADVIGLVLL